MNTGGSSSLTLDDSEDLVGQTALMSDNGTTGAVFDLSPATINYTDADISSLTVLGGSGGNSFTVQGTLVNAGFPATLTTLNKGPGGPNSVDVLATSAGSTLDIVGTGGPDTVTVGNGNMGTILGVVNVTEAPASTNLVIDLSTDGLPHNLDLSSDGTTGTLSDTLGNLPHNITYNVAAINSLTIDTDPTQDETLNLSFAGGGNPIPTGGSPGLIFNAGDPVAGVTHALNISGELPTGPFASETHNANDQTVFPQVGQYGSIFFTDSAGNQHESRLHRAPANHRHDAGRRLHVQRLRLPRPVVQRHRPGNPDPRFDRVRQYPDAFDAAEFRDDRHHQQELRHVQYAGTRRRPAG